MSRAERTALVNALPVVGAVTAGVSVAAIAAIVYATLAVAAALALAAAERRIESAHLRTLGLSDRQQAGLVVVEYVPTVVLAFALGAALGFGLFAFLRPGLGLPTVIGSTVDVPVGVEPFHLFLLLGAVGLIVALGLAIGTAVQRGAPMVSSIRRGIDFMKQYYGEGAQIVCDNLVRIYKVADLEVVALQGLDLLVQERRDDRHRRRLGQRQVDAAQHPRRARRPVRRARRRVAGHDLGAIGASRADALPAPDRRVRSGSRPRATCCRT